MSSAIQEHTISRDVLPARLPAIGMIKIGRLRPKVTSAKGNDFQPPEKLDFFLITRRERGTDGNFVRDDEVHEKVGEKPTELDVRLPFDTRAENFYAQMVSYSGRSKSLECDGQTCSDLSTHTERTCSRRLGKECPCKPYARLGVIIEAAPTFGGLYVYRTTSWETANSLQTALKMFEQQFGTLRGLPLKLRLYPAEVRYKVGNQEKTATAYKVALVLRADYEVAQQAALEFHRRAQIARKEILQLASGTARELEAVDQEDEDAIGAEFFPESGPVVDNQDAPRPASKLAEMNKAILGGPGSEEPAEKVGTLVTELLTLIDQAKASEVALTEKQSEMLSEAVSSKNEGDLRSSIAWLTDRISGKKEEGSTDE